MKYSRHEKCWNMTVKRGRASLVIDYSRSSARQYFTDCTLCVGYCLDWSIESLVRVGQNSLCTTYSYQTRLSRGVSFAITLIDN